MGLLEIKAYKCEWCGRVFEIFHPSHDDYCPYNPKAKNCLTCEFDKDLVKRHDLKTCYCPKRNAIFEYPRFDYCPEWKQNPQPKE